MITLPTIDAQDVLGIEPQVFGDSEEADIEAIVTDYVKGEVVDDIADELQMNAEDDEAVLQSLIDDNAKVAKKALLYKSLEIYFAARDDGEGSMTHARMMRYMRLYAEQRRRFQSFSPTGVTRKVTFGVVTR